MRKKTTIQYRKNLLIQNLSLNSKIPEKESTHLAGHNLFFDTPYNVNIDRNCLNFIEYFKFYLETNIAVLFGAFICSIHGTV